MKEEEEEEEEETFIWKLRKVVVVVVVVLFCFVSCFINVVCQCAVFREFYALYRLQFPSTHPSDYISAETIYEADPDQNCKKVQLLC